MLIVIVFVYVQLFTFFIEYKNDVKQRKMFLIYFHHFYHAVLYSKNSKIKFKVQIISQILNTKNM